MILCITYQYHGYNISLLFHMPEEQFIVIYNKNLFLRLKNAIEKRDVSYDDIVISFKSMSINICS